MSNTKSSLPLKKSIRGGKSKHPGIGCSILTGVFLVGLIIVAVVAGLGFSNFLSNGQAATALSGLEDKTSPEILQARREKEEARLNSYGWIDKEAGLVRIPIAQAMALVAESGLPVGSEPTEEPPPTLEPPTAIPAPEVNSEVPAAETPVAREAATAIPAPDSAGEPSDQEMLTLDPPPTVPFMPAVNLAAVSFKEQVLPILEQHCVECHGGEKPQGGVKVEEGLILTTYDDILYGSFNGPVIEPGNVEDSYLIEQVVTGRMPKEGDRLTPAEIEIITAWIEAGAPNN
jgi:mono/diheme cytochrome c family protein